MAATLASKRSLAKRILVGRQMPSSRMIHTLLPKSLALPVFSADALSSVAYCVEASMLVLVGAGLSALRLVVPIQIGIALLMAIVVASYRQTVRAYPTGGGSYIVSKDNLGTMPGLIAAAALLTDYVLTVSVSVAGGVLAIASAVPALRGDLVPLSLLAVAFIAAMNLRGVRESGLLFAFPVYGFIVSALFMIGVGFVKCLHGCPQAVAPDPVPVGTATIGIFVVLHAFASGSSALTGVEAISNGIRAFRRPQSRNAAQTLMAMGVIGIALIVGTGILASRMHAQPSSSVSVISEIARAIFPGSGGNGGPMFYAFQVFTFAILILAANTSYQDFPRLSAILARDRFMPRQFENLGDRLVFSNGVFVLTALSALLLIIFKANVDTLIQLYVVGVFTAFTLSQTGMVRHWIKEGRAGGPLAQGWRRRAATNGVGAVATGIVTIVVIATKFSHGAWIVIVAVPLIVALFYGVHRHYAQVEAVLRSGTASPDRLPESAVVLYVPALDEATARAVGYVTALYRDAFRAVHPVAVGDQAISDGAWAAFSRTRVPLETIPGNGRRVREFLRYVHRVPRAPGGVVAVVIPELLTSRSLFRAVRRGPAFALKVRLLSEPDVVVMNVPVLAAAAETKTTGARVLGSRPGRPRRTEAIVLVSSVNDATIRAIAFARSQRVDAVRALCCVMDPGDVQGVWDDWIERRIPIEISFVDAPFRDLGPPILDEVRAVTAGGDGVAIVVLPELVVPTFRHELLHNQRALYIKRLLLFEPNVVLASVPYALVGPEPQRQHPARRPGRKAPYKGGRRPAPVAAPARVPASRGAAVSH